MTNAWTLTQHACRFCGGRVLESEGAFQCATCGATTTGAVESLCGCGIATGLRPTLAPRPRKGEEPAKPRKSGGFRCSPNPARSPHSPAEIVILFGGSAL